MFPSTPAHSDGFPGACPAVIAAASLSRAVCHVSVRHRQRKAVRGGRYSVTGHFPSAASVKWKRAVRPSSSECWVFRSYGRFAVPINLPVVQIVVKSGKAVSTATGFPNGEGKGEPEQGGWNVNMCATVLWLCFQSPMTTTGANPSFSRESMGHQFSV